MSDYKKKSDELEKKIQDKKLEKAKMEQRLDSLKTEETELIDELKSSGIEDISTLPTWLEERKQDLESKLAEIEKQLGD